MDNFPLKKIRDDFPILSSRINNHQLVYFDNAATTQKPQSVIDGISIITKIIMPIFIGGSTHLQKKLQKSLKKLDL